MSNYKEGQIHMVSDALEQKGGFTSDDMTLLGQATPEQLTCIREYLRGTHQIVERDYCGLTETDLLRPVATAVASGKGILDEDAFFQSREGEIWATPSFREKFGSTFRKSRSSDWEYVASELKQNASDTDIRADLPVSHLSKLGDIARFIKAQRGGKKGFLLNDGRANIFYVEGKDSEVFAVLVNWFAAVRAWCVVDW